MSDEFDTEGVDEGLRRQLQHLADHADAAGQPSTAGAARARGHQIRTRRRFAAGGVAAAVLIAGIGVATAVLPSTQGPPPVVATPADPSPPSGPPVTGPSSSPGSSTSSGPTNSSDPSTSSGSTAPTVGDAELPTPGDFEPAGGGIFPAGGESAEWRVDEGQTAIEVPPCLESFAEAGEPTATRQQFYVADAPDSERVVTARAITVQYADASAAQQAWDELADFGEVCQAAHTAADNPNTVDGPYPVSTIDDARYAQLPIAMPGDGGAFHVFGMVLRGSHIGLIDLRPTGQDFNVANTPAQSQDLGLALNPMWGILPNYAERLG